ncbi:urea amidolyase related protein : Urea amidolyase related protein OS=Alicyclobacillus acidocaldarius subsp. acidocaldarius (strain ATCC 27009 / DSM 446 / 104-1A) GN=Aaci_2789 PE=4 SV=1: AHS2 [Gemmata massiliana]|uniref:Carboxyltransferase domain-containing protein n=1 Tax=Gemmata massiliana TaxID=1210884 RepID=A0A6P2CR30_9BACT|nr:biotin-dependent carboxyltransferase family protein [Gemmata massiliana]VTR90776.1 urea amidolyase related protein : Urea amidolyase related protein OS=Alicyclobacillus acidocaldarius subsp. acidocaldarius (strain ATCC 27009 / DSM 446 / 104-1A) GN=Aaci_2789 PE=4 SV=1: AHS2 [Gemmata massiliana]
MSLTVREPGLQSLLVDFGRERSRALGVSVGGAADRAALNLGNALVGNAPHAVALEVAFAGPTLEAHHSVACVIFGAPFQSTLNGNPLPTGTTFTLESGDTLRVGGTRTGARAYLCVAGGFHAEEMLGSRSALEPIRVGNTLRCAVSRTEPRGLPFCEVRPNPPTPFPRKEGGAEPTTTGITQQAPVLSPSPFRGGVGEGLQQLRVLNGPQRDWFIDDTFFTQIYEVSAASNRMGLRLKGIPLSRVPGELVSEAVAPGAVQVTNDGLPIVLGVDGQTIGGYPKVAHIIRADLDLLAQLRPNDRVQFVCVSPDKADRAARARAAFLSEWVTRLRIAERQPVIG